MANCTTDPEYSISLNIRHVPNSDPCLFEVIAPAFSSAITGDMPVVDALSSPHISLSSSSLTLLRFAMQLPQLLEKQIISSGGTVSHVSSPLPTSPHPIMTFDATSSHGNMDIDSQAMTSPTRTDLKRRPSGENIRPDTTKRPRPDQSDPAAQEDATGPPVVYCVKNLPENPEYRERLVDFFKWAGIQVSYCRWNREPEDPNFMLPFAFFETCDPSLTHVDRVRILRDRRFYGKALRIYTPAEEIDIREDHFKALERAAKYAEDIYDEEERRRPRDRFHGAPNAHEISGDIRRAPSPTRGLENQITRFRIHNIPASRTYGQTLRGLFSQAGEVLNMKWDLPSSRLERTACVMIEVVRNIHSTRRMLGLRGVVLDGRVIDVEALDSVDPADQPSKPPAIFIVTNIPPTGPRVGLLRQVFSAKGYVHYVDWHYRRSDRQCFAYISMADDSTLLAEDLEGYDFHGSALRVQRIPNVEDFFNRPVLLEECIIGSSLTRVLNGAPREIRGLSTAPTSTRTVSRTPSVSSVPPTPTTAATTTTTTSSSSAPKANPWLPSSWTMGDPLKLNKSIIETNTDIINNTVMTTSLPSLLSIGNGEDGTSVNVYRNGDASRTDISNENVEVVGTSTSIPIAESDIAVSGDRNRTTIITTNNNNDNNDNTNTMLNNGGGENDETNSYITDMIIDQKDISQPITMNSTVTTPIINTTTTTSPLLKSRPPPDANDISTERLKYVVFRDVPIIINEMEVNTKLIELGADGCTRAFRDGDNVVLMFDAIMSSFMVAALGELEFAGRMIKGEVATNEYLVHLYTIGSVDVPSL